MNKLLLISFVLLVACGGDTMRSYKLAYLVDDSPTSLHAAEARVVHVSGVAVRSFTNGRDAIDALKTEKPDLLITDLAMPGVDGWQVISAANERGVPCIVITTDDIPPDLVNRLRQAGVAYWLSKGQLDLLPDVVETAIRDAS